MPKFKLVCDYTDEGIDQVVTHEFSSMQLTDVLDNVELFLRGAGYVFDGQLDTVAVYESEDTLQPPDPFADVETFLRAVGQEVPREPQETVSPQAELYKNLIKEEVEEFWEAVAASDDVEELDACFDMIWVIIGYMKSRGWNCDSSWEEGARSNLSKIDPLTGLVRRREDGKILKPEGWQPPDFSKFVK